LLLQRVLELVLVADVDDLLELTAFRGVVGPDGDGISFDCRAGPIQRTGSVVAALRPAIAFSTATAFAPCPSAERTRPASLRNDDRYSIPFGDSLAQASCPGTGLAKRSLLKLVSK